MLGEQLDLFAPPPPPPKPRDLVREAILEAGIAPSDYLLDLNRNLTNPDTLEIPSRLLRFPIAYFDGKRTGTGQSALYLNHPDVGGACPYVAHVEQVLGMAIPWREKDEFGREFGALPRWWHAVDLVSADRYSALLETANLTDLDNVAGAVDFRLTCGASSYTNGGAADLDALRDLLEEFGAAEPGDKSEAAISKGALGPTPLFVDDSGKPRQTPRWAFNPGRWRAPSPVRAWCYIHALEAGYLAQRKKGGMIVTPAGVDRFNLASALNRDGKN